MRIFDKIQEKNKNESGEAPQQNNLLKYKSYKKIYMELLAVILVFSVLPCFLVGFWANYYIKNVVLDNYMEEYLDSVYENVKDGMNHYIDQVSAYAVYIFTDGKIFSYMRDENLTNEQKTELVREYLGNNESRLDISLDIVADSDFVIQNDDKGIVMPQKNYDVKLSHTNIVILNELAHDKNGEKYIVFGRQVYNMLNDNHEFDLYIYVPESEIYKAIEEINSKDNLIYFTVNDMIMSHPEKDKLGRYVIFPNEFGTDMSQRRVGDYFYDYRPMKLKIATEGEWVIESRMSYKELYRSTEQLQRETLIILIFAVMISILFAVVVPISLLKSLSSLKKRMNDFVSGGAEHNGRHFSYAEIYELEESFNKMVVEINDLMERNVMEKEKQRRAELQALQAQINPHFIYNALDSIAWYAKIEKQSFIADMVYELATFFRISLHKGDNIIRLHEEISHVESFIAIEQMRFPGMFEVEYKIQEDLLSEKMVKIILQPIVENCIKHGFENIDSGGKINITAYSSGEDIIFEVEDNGHGMDFDPLSKEAEESVGYGIRNVNERIRLEYGEEYGLQYSSIPGEGTVVKIKIGKIAEN